MDTQFAEVTCEHCGTALVLHYERLAAPPSDKHSIGCPECQATTSVVALWHSLERDAAPEFIRLTALERKTEIGLGSARPVEPGVGRPRSTAERRP